MVQDEMFTNPPFEMSIFEHCIYEHRFANKMFVSVYAASDSINIWRNYCGFDRDPEEVFGAIEIDGGNGG